MQTELAAPMSTNCAHAYGETFPRERLAPDKQYRQGEALPRRKVPAATLPEDDTLRNGYLEFSKYREDKLKRAQNIAPVIFAGQFRSTGRSLPGMRL